MKRFLNALLLGFVLFAFSSCDVLNGSLTDSSVSVVLRTDKDSYFSSRNIVLTADVTNPSGKDLSYQWFRDGQLMGSGGAKDFNVQYTTVYAATVTDSTFSVEVSNGTNKAVAKKKVTVAPYTESNAATVTITNSYGANLYQVIVAVAGPTYKFSSWGTNVLTTSVLAPNAAVTITGLAPGQYWIVGLDSLGNKYSNGFSSVNLVAGPNSYSIH